eukprot:gnl/TRDRNA2_/TRDRNA2_189493_c0_seq1.p1 gnl/TRDRNA2_/TRDRNA2_189493_c0~~gnl/TRDRNA2_/TRDRNA2_189493_c0_seq1.p1  ORF type:complete len:193 (+),score=38.22 gnl/TRDRNA2_/TRDRNA2_189493_c0_seq1:74-580(+)
MAEVEGPQSALRENIATKGDNAYYYAHNRKFEVPADAKVVTGPGLITGGPPELLASDGAKLDPSVEERTVTIKDYSWADSGAKVKVYVELPEGVLPAEGADEIVSVDFEAKSLILSIRSEPRQRLEIKDLNAEIEPENCSRRVEPQKKRVVLVLSKKRDQKWYDLTKK